MALADFLKSLFESGRVKVGPPDESPTPADQESSGRVLAEWEAAQRVEFPGEAPPLSVEVARWAAERFYRACQLAVYRDLGAAELAALETPAPAAAGPILHYNVDLTFRFLPDLYRLAHGKSAEDPLCEQLMRWAGCWPLASVGMRGVNLGDVTPISEHAGLLRVYVDRILARGDASRLGDARVRAAAEAALGHFVDLAPSLKTHFPEPARG